MSSGEEAIPYVAGAVGALALAPGALAVAAAGLLTWQPRNHGSFQIPSMQPIPPFSVRTGLSWKQSLARFPAIPCCPSTGTDTWQILFQASQSDSFLSVFGCMI